MILPIGPLINALAIAVGALAGMALGSRLPECVRTIVFQGLGLCILVTGMQMAFVTKSPVILIFSVLLGGVAGELLRLEERFMALGDRLKRLLKSGNPRFTEGLVNTTVLVCIGAMAIVGSFDEGLRGDRTVVFSKAVMDGFAALALASAYGLGVAFAAVPLLQREPAGVVDYGGDWLPALYSREFDGADAPLAGKRGALIGMGLTEKQGGSDLRAVTTRAAPLGAAGRGCAYQLVGHKWFFSVPQAAAHLVLAQADEGLSCFFVPRWIPDGPRNAVRIRRLKDKLGNHSNASAEVEFEDAWGVMVGEPGRGLAVLLEDVWYLCRPEAAKSAQAPP